MCDLVEVNIRVQSGKNHWWLGVDGVSCRQWFHTTPATYSHPSRLSAAALANLQGRFTNSRW